MSELSKLASQAMIQPQETLSATASREKRLFIGVPKEIAFQERRICLTPLSVGLLVENGHEVIMETGAGLGSNFLDHHYSEQGARIVSSAEEVYQADCIVKISAPTLKEVGMMKPNQILMSSLQPSLLELPVLRALIQKKITALSFEYLRDEGGCLAVVRAMGEIVGATSTLIASEYLSNSFGGKGLMLGGITGVPPTEMVIIGAGTVGEYAARTAIALGAQVKVFDNSIYKLRRLQNNLGSPVYTSIIQPAILNKAVRTCDVVIGALRSKTGRTPCVISEETVSEMKPNAVVIDVSIDQGGCFETSNITSHDEPTFRKYDVIHYCVPNIASRVARSATYALTNIFTPILLDIAEQGGLKNVIWKSAGIRSATYLYQGILTNKDIASKFEMTAKDLDLIIVTNL
ncbi:alanine dehydrogenase [Sphingobacterium faecium NBRC 15299]|jgi:alanine dehydrogenase|uniref:alanine dehydrogenase n=1 Tax=Sphingobacterium faecium TaxID=34087 RepID=UPI000D3CACE7|nr:alanine dehydrogenase [Sphingobacterium faecium]MQP26071.1 alanine dehydrogenase [Sphingobacterium faecium]PTX10974.1 alanine dehydrogenase [Sphingobacterium faecium]GEM62845.1 alanine dehydrogenase [Sphingobacterium faecium NBRC 15299]